MNPEDKANLQVLVIKDDSSPAAERFSDEDLDFGTVDYVEKFSPPLVRKLELRNSSADLTVTIFAAQARILTSESLAGSFPLRADIEVDSAAIVDEDCIVLLPLESVRCSLLITSLLNDVAVPWSLRTSFNVIKSSLQIKYAVQSASGGHEVIGEGVPQRKLSIKYRAIMCTSVLQLDEPMIEFPSCVLHKLYTKEMHIWNRSESVLTFSLHPVLDTAQQQADIPVTVSDGSMVFQDEDTDAVVEFNTPYNIPAFASKSVRIAFTAKAIGNWIYSYKVVNLKNPLNSPSITCKISVDGELDGDSMRMRCPIALEGEDSSVDLIAIDAADEVGQTELNIGKCYCGYRNLRRYWIFNNGSTPVSVWFKADQGAEVDVFEREIQMEASEQRFSDVPSRAMSVQAVATMRSIPTGRLDQQINIKDSDKSNFVQEGCDDAMTPKLVESSGRHAQPQLIKGLPISKTEVMEVEQSAGRRNSTNEDGFVFARSANTRYAAGAKDILPVTNSSATTALLHKTDTDYDKLITWNQLREAAVDGKRRKMQNDSSRGLLSLSGICGRAWGDRALSGEFLMNQSAISRVDIDTREHHFNSLGFNDLDKYMFFCSASQQRYFIGDVSTAAKVIKAGKSYGKVKIGNYSGLERQVPPANGNDKQTSLTPLVDEPTICDDDGGFVGEIDSPSAMMGDKEASCADDQKDDKDMLISLVLLPQERRQVYFWVTPSFGTLEEKSATVVSDKLLDVTTEVSMYWLPLSPENWHSNGDILGRHDSQRLKIQMIYQTCVSRISVSPSVYNLGLCNIGEYRSAAFEVVNKSQLPAVIFPVTHCDRLEVSEKEIRLQPNEARTINFDYIPLSEGQESKLKATLVNGYNFENSLDVEVKAINVDPLQIFLHSMFYKLITYNDQRQLQVHYEHALVNRPNLRIFRIKNVHSHPLKIEILLNSRVNIKLYQLLKSGAAVRVNYDNTSLGDARKSDLQEISASVSAQLRDDIEDMKWDAGGGSGAVNNLQDRIRTRRSYSFRLDFDEAMGLGKSSGADGKLRASPTRGLASTWGAGDIVHTTKRNVISQGSVLDSKGMVEHSSTFNALDVPERAAVPSIAGKSKTESPLTNSNDVQLRMHTRLSSEENVKPKVRFEMIDKTEEMSTAEDDESKMTREKMTRSEKSIAEEEVDDELQYGFEAISQFDSGFPFDLLSSLADAGSSDAQEDAGTISKQVNGMVLKNDFGRKSLDSAIIAKASSQHEKKGSIPLDADDSSISDIEKRIRFVERSFDNLKTMLGSQQGGQLQMLNLKKIDNMRSQNGTPKIEGSAICDVGTAPIEIAANESCRFALIFEPAPADNSDLQSELQLNQVEIREYIQIRLIDIDSEYMQTALLDKNFTQAIDEHDQKRLTGITPVALKPRLLPVLANAVRSELVLIQKNLSFGRTLVGDKTFRVVTVVNRSSIPCLYSISKSGSISSGFLQIPGGRKGVVPAFSSKYVEIMFKPTLAGSFEEVITFRNVLNPANFHNITIKAKVSKTEAFVLSAVQKEAAIAVNAPKDGTAEEIDSSILMLKELSFEAFLNAALEGTLQHSSETLRSLPGEPIKSKGQSGFGIGQGASGAAIGSIMVNMGKVTVGDLSQIPIIFRIRNVTSKRRQFIVDAMHSRSLILLYPSSATAAVPDEHNAVAQKSEIIDPPHLMKFIPFEPIPDVLQSILMVRCIFQSEVIKSSSGDGGDGAAGDNKKLSEEERTALEDSLEHYQQKLKIAIRKNKADKIAKYQLKINTVISALRGNAVEKQIDEVATILKKTTSKAGNLTDLGESQPEQRLAAVVGAVENHFGMDQKSEGTYHFYLEPDQERLVQVRITFLPGPNYRLWSGYLPFCGSLQVFECKNEDSIKTVQFGAMVRSTKSEITSSIPFDTEVKGIEIKAGRDHDHVGKVPGSSPLCATAVPEKKPSSLDERLPAQSVRNSFITTVAPWSLLQTQGIYPRHRQLPGNVLSTSVKLVRAAKERVMHGSLTIASLMERTGTIQISVADMWSTSALPSGYTAFNGLIHGPVKFFAVSSEEKGSDSSMPEDFTIQQGEVGSEALVIKIGTAEPTTSALQYEKEQIVSKAEATSKTITGSKIKLLIQWRPSADLQVSKDETERPDKHLKILGALKVTFFMADDTAGSTQIVPFTGVLEHQSNFRVKKYLNFETVAAGTYRVNQISITNKSDTDKLHYQISSEEVSEGSRQVGKVDILSGQTGIIPRSGIKDFSVLFSATAPGKFEQKLWIRNLRDSFDQKLIVIQAQVLVAQTDFVVFPDLEHSTETAGKYKPIDLGLIQIQSAKSKSPSQLEIKNAYKLRIRNVSDKALVVTAVSNLKSQCFIFSNPDCTQLAVNSPLPNNEERTLYLVLHPVSVARASGTWHASGGKPLALSQDENSFGATSMASKRSYEVSMTQPLDPMTAKNEFDSEEFRVNSHNSECRDLSGGIKLIFFEHFDSPIDSTAPHVSPSEDALPFVMESSNEGELLQPPPISPNSFGRKLFETAIGFRAVVGTSKLAFSDVVRSGDDNQHGLIKQRQREGILPSLYTLVHQSIASECSGLICRCGEFELGNASGMFPLNYRYQCTATVQCIGENGFISPDILKENQDERVLLLIHDSEFGHLPAGSKKRVTYSFLFYDTLKGLVIFPLRVMNSSTSEDISTSLSCLVDDGTLKVVGITASSHGSDHYSELSTVDHSMSVDESEIFSETSGVPSNASCTESVNIHPERKMLSWMKCTAPIWLVRLECRDTMTSAGIHDRDTAMPLPVVLEEHPLEEPVVEVMSPRPTRSSEYCVAGARSLVICEWKMLNCGNRPMTLTPVSDLPLTISIEFIDELGESRAVSYRQFVVAQRNKSTFPFLSKWKSDLVQCGETFVLNPLQSVRVSVAVRRGAWLSNDKVDHLGGTKRLDSGRLVNMKGVVAFLHDHSFVGGTNSAEMDCGAENSHPSRLPISGIVPISCKVSTAQLELPKMELSVGRIRCGMQKSFEVAIDNHSDVDVPCALEGLPSWLRIHLRDDGADLTTHTMRTMNNPRNESRQERRKKANVKDSEEVVMEGISYATDLSNPIYPATSRAVAIRKLRNWIASDGYSISGASLISKQSTPLDFVISSRGKSVEDSTCLTRSEHHDENRTHDDDDAIDDASMSSNAHPTLQGSDSGCGDMDGEYDEEGDVNESPLPMTNTRMNIAAQLDTQSSLDVNLDLVHLSSPHYLTMQKFMRNALITNQTLQSKDKAMKTQQPSVLRSAPNMFYISKRSRFWLKGVIVAPTIESQTLEHTLKINNLATSYMATANTATEQSIGQVLQLKVKMSVDARRAFDIIPAVDEVLLRCKDSKHYNVTSDRKYSINECAAVQEQHHHPSGFICPSAGLHFCRVISNALTIPRSAELSEITNSMHSRHSDKVQQVLTRPKELESHCRFSVKNNLEHSIRVEYNVWINPLLEGMLDFVVKFQLTSGSYVDLLPEEKSATKIRVEPKVDARLRVQQGSLQLYPVEELRADNVTQSVIQEQPMHQRLNYRMSANGDLIIHSDVEEGGRGSGAQLGTVQLDTKDFVGPMLLGSVQLQAVSSKDDKRSLIGKKSMTVDGLDADTDAESQQVSLMEGGILSMASSTSMCNPQDVSVFDIVGYLQAGPTSFATVPALSQYRNSSEREIQSRVSVRNCAVVAFIAEPLPDFHAIPQSMTPKRAPVLGLMNSRKVIYLINPSETSSLRFCITSKSYRHAGMRLQLKAERDPNEENMDYENSETMDSFDTVTVVAYPERSAIPPSSSMEVIIELRPGDVSSSVKAMDSLTADVAEVANQIAATTINCELEKNSEKNIPNSIPEGLGAKEHYPPPLKRSSSGRDFVPDEDSEAVDEVFPIACIPIEVWDEDSPQHPPNIVQTYLMSRVPLPILLTQPMLANNCGRGFGDDILGNISEKGEGQVDNDALLCLHANLEHADVASDQESSTVTTTPIVSRPHSVRLQGQVLLLQGAAPHDHLPNRFSIDVGKQIQKRESIEWQLTMRNAAEFDVDFSVKSVLKEETSSWLTISQTGGSIVGGGMGSFLLYLSRSRIGKYFAYVMVHDKRDKTNDLVVSVAMEVVSDPKRSLSVVESVNIPMSAVTEVLDSSSFSANDERGSLPSQIFVDPASSRKPAHSSALAAEDEKCDSSISSSEAAKAQEIIEKTAMQRIRTKNLYAIDIVEEQTVPRIDKIIDTKDRPTPLIQDNISATAIASEHDASSHAAAESGTSYRSTWGSKQLTFYFDSSNPMLASFISRSFVVTNLCDVPLDFLVKAEIFVQLGDNLQRLLPFELALPVATEGIKIPAPDSDRFTELLLSLNPKRQQKVDISLNTAVVMNMLRGNTNHRRGGLVIVEGSLVISCRLFSDHIERIGIVVTVE